MERARVAGRVVSTFTTPKIKLEASTLIAIRLLAPQPSRPSLDKSWPILRTALNGERRIASTTQAPITEVLKILDSKAFQGRPPIRPPPDRPRRA